MSFTAGDKNYDNTNIHCDDTVIISADEFLDTPNNQLTIISVQIKEDSLLIEFGSSGYSGKCWSKNDQYRYCR